MTNILHTYHPDGEGFRGMYQTFQITSICKHSHSTSNAAEGCAKKTRAAINKKAKVAA